MSNNRTYPSQEAQDEFLALPKSNQDALVAIHEIEAHAINDTMRSRTASILEDTALDSLEVIVAGVRMNRGYLKPPTREEIHTLDLEEPKDRNDVHGSIPQYRILTIDDLDAAKKVFPYRSEDELEASLPYEVAFFNKKATDAILKHRSIPNVRKERRLTGEEADKIVKYAKENGIDTVIEETYSGYTGYYDASEKTCECAGVGNWACFSVGDGSLWIWLDPDDGSIDCDSLESENFVTVWSVSENVA